MSLNELMLGGRRYRSILCSSLTRFTLCMWVIHVSWLMIWLYLGGRGGVGEGHATSAA